MGRICRWDKRDTENMVYNYFIVYSLKFLFILLLDLSHFLNLYILQGLERPP